MKPNDLPVEARVSESESAELLSPLLHAPRGHGAVNINAVAVGELLALADGHPIVRCAAVLGEQAVSARSTVDLHGSHIGQAVLLAFELGDAARPIVVGVLRGDGIWPLETPPAQVEVDADGQRMVVNAKEQLVLRCGKASITLTKSGKVLIEGTYVSSRSSGLQRLQGATIELN
jgi:Domain of unknown function (DUF6484)